MTASKSHFEQLYLKFMLRTFPESVCKLFQSKMK